MRSMTWCLTLALRPKLPGLGGMVVVALLRLEEISAQSLGAWAEAACRLMVTGCLGTYAVEL
jgi:hypothetical protein